VDYAETDYQSQETSGNTISTATLWTLKKEPGISPWAGAYVPKELNHLSVPDAALHERYGLRVLAGDPGSALVRSTARLLGCKFPQPDERAH
jgi:hypothetical protein